jgi:hypothetical protein
LNKIFNPFEKFFKEGGGAEKIEKSVMPEVVEKTPEELWKENEFNIALRFGEIFDFEKIKKKERWDDVEAERIKKLTFEREKEFFLAVVSEARKIKRSGAEKFLTLFDINETIGSRVNDKAGNPKTILRLSLVPVLDYLKKTGGSVGFLSSRDCGRTIECVDEKNHFAGIKDYLDKKYIFSSREEKCDFDSVRFEEEINKEFGGEKGIVDDSIVDSIDEGGCPSTVDDMQKLSALKKIRSKIKNTPILSVDNSRFPKLLNNRNGMYGVSLYDSGIFVRPCIGMNEV